jgi:sugar phosphate isomerase/epimerase
MADNVKLNVSSQGDIMKKLVMAAVFLALVFAFSYAQGQQRQSGEVIDYAKVRIREFPIAMQCWTFHTIPLFELLPKVKALGITYLQAYPGQVLSKDNPDKKLIHTMSDEDIGRVKKALAENGITIVAYGVVTFDNTEKSMREVFDFARKMGIRTICTEPPFEDYTLLEKMVREYNIAIAIHNHPDPSKFARPETVAKAVKGCDERIGACADTGHWMRTGVNPLEALRLLSGRIIDVHLKDLNTFGDKEAVDVPFGAGKANIHDILAELTLQNYHGFLTVEHENPNEIDNPSPSIRKGIDYINSITYYKGYEELLSWDNGRYNKHGWNHYGPGYFELDEKTGILKSHKGMGLFWYSRKKFKDFILEVDYRTEVPNANSGIFYRIPNIPTSDAYIFNSFEVQIDDSQTGIHQTGAIYDAEAPKFAAFNKTGEWNHFKITLMGKNVKVELNDKPIVDWNMEPRGKIREYALDGYFGLQNHDYDTSVYFRNIFLKELK